MRWLLLLLLLLMRTRMLLHVLLGVLLRMRLWRGLLKLLLVRRRRGPLGRRTLLRRGCRRRHRAINGAGS